MARPLLFRFYVDAYGRTAGGEFGFIVLNEFAPSWAEALEQARGRLVGQHGARVCADQPDSAPDVVLEIAADGTRSTRLIAQLPHAERMRVLSILATQSSLLVEAA